MTQPLVTFVVATYRRADALRSTLRSVQLQTIHDWEVIVVGDKCDVETERAIRSIGDARIRYYNFPERFGEQTGPNNFGLNLARGTYLCFLNHDDLLLPDHLERSIAVMERETSELHIGRAANATGLEEDPSGKILPVFTALLPTTTDLDVLAHPDPYLFEPSSFWLVKTAYARKVGPWTHSSRLFRPPFRDWLMRTVKLGGAVSFGDHITGLRFQTHTLRGEERSYDAMTPEHETVIAWMETSTSEEVRERVLVDLERATGRSSRDTSVIRDDNAGGDDESVRRRSIPGQSESRVRRLLRFVARRLWGWFGIDPVTIEARLRGRRRGALHTALLRNRTGESIEQITDIDPWIRDPESIRVL